MAKHIDPTVQVRTLLFQAAGRTQRPQEQENFDQVWPTHAVTPNDYCAELAAH